VVIAVVGLTAATANADLWRRASEGHAVDAVDERYDDAIAIGDALVTQAQASSASITQIKKMLVQAEERYRAAAESKPESGEPYFRIAQMLQHFFVDCHVLSNGIGPIVPARTCDALHPSTAVVKRMIDAWDQFEARSPLDPRVTNFLTERGIERTKLVEADPKDRSLLEGARKDYETFLARSDGLTHGNLVVAWGNLAETYMMLGQLDDAIPAYQRAIRLGGGAEIAYGLAVALDRNDRGIEALSLVRDLGTNARISFEEAVTKNLVFYVPDGEIFYYLALTEEAFGERAQALRSWRRYVTSGAHPEFQPRARAHIDALTRPTQGQRD